MIKAMTEQIYIYDQNHSRVRDLEQAIRYATNMRFGSQWPNGYSTCSFEVRRRDVFKNWDVIGAYTVIVKDGLTDIWEGRLLPPRASYSGAEENVTLEAVGPRVYLGERLILATWYREVSPQAGDFRGFNWPESLGDKDVQKSYVLIQKQDRMEIKLGDKDRSYTKNSDIYRILYELPQGFGYSQVIRSVAYTYDYRTGEGMSLILYNVDQASNEDVESPGVQVTLITNNNVSQVFAAGDTTSFEFRINPETDLFDQNDYVILYNWVVTANYQAGHPAQGSEAWAQDELIIDTILMANQKGRGVISEDFDQVTQPNQALTPYVVDQLTPADQVIQDIINFGDGEGGTWGYAVWGRQGTTDNRPKFEITKYDTSTWDYEVELNQWQLAALSYELDDSQIANRVYTEYIDIENRLKFITPDDNAGNEDTDSQDTWYWREYSLKLGQSASAEAILYSERYLSFHAEPIPRLSFTVVDQIKKADGSYVPVNRIRAGERVFIRNLGITIFLRDVRYDSESRAANLSSADQPDGIASMLAKARFENEKANRERHRQERF